MCCNMVMNQIKALQHIERAAQILSFGGVSGGKRKIDLVDLTSEGEDDNEYSASGDENYIPLSIEYKKWPSCQIEDNPTYQATDKKIEFFMANIGKRYKNVNYAITRNISDSAVKTERVKIDQYFVVDTEPVQVDRLHPREAHDIVKKAQTLLLDVLLDHHRLLDLKFEDIQRSKKHGQIFFSMRPLFRYRQNEVTRASFAHPILLVAHKGCINQFTQKANAAWDIAMTAVSYHLSMLFFILQGFKVPRDHVDYYAWKGTLEEFSRDMLNNWSKELVSLMPFSQILFEVVRPYAMTILYAHLGQEMLLKNNKRDYNDDHEYAKPYRRQNVDHDQIIAPLFFWTGLNHEEWNKFFGDDTLYGGHVPSQENEKLHSCTNLFKAQSAVQMTVKCMEEQGKQFEVQCVVCTSIQLIKGDRRSRKAAIACTYKNSKGESVKCAITHVEDNVQENKRIATIHRMRPTHEIHTFSCEIVSFTCKVGSGEFHLRPKCPCQGRELGCTFIHMYHACMAQNGFIEVYPRPVS